MLNTTLKKITAAIPALGLLVDAKLPIKAAYAVSKLADKCNAELETYNKIRAKRFEEAGCVVTDGKYTHPDGEEKVQAVVKELDALLDDTVEININPLDIEQFGNGDVPGAAFLGLEWAMKPQG